MSKIKKILITILFFTVAFPMFAQNNPTFFDSPRWMQKDTLWTPSRVTRDFYFNPGDNSGQWKYNEGTIDLAIYDEMEGQATGKVTVEAYGIVEKIYKNSNGSDSTVTYYVDSCQVQSATNVDSTISIFALDSQFSPFKMYDGIRIVYKRTVADSINVWSNLRIRFKWWQGR